MFAEQHATAPHSTPLSPTCKRPAATGITLDVRRAAAVLLAAIVLPVAGCGGDSGSSGAKSDWEGPPQERGGTIDVAPFNDYLAEHGEFGRSPIEAASEFLRLDRAPAGTTSIESQIAGEQPSPVSVTVTLDRLPDDSVRARRYVLVFNKASSDQWRLSSAVVTQRCWQNRGHQDFSSALCV